MSKQNRWRVLWGCAVSKNFFDVAHAHSKASNKNSAMAVSGGLSYSPSGDRDEVFDVPPPYWLLRDLPIRFRNDPKTMMACAAMYGLKNFRLTVLGLSKHKKGYNTKYACRCSCGAYCYRTAKGLRDSKHAACGVCLQKRNRIIQEHHRKTSVYLDDAVVWQRMGGA